MMTIAVPPARRKWSKISFPSTLHLYPVLDLLLDDIPLSLKPEIRLGLQEALVNAAKHGNNLDPQKSVSVQFYRTKDSYFWIISDEGTGFISEKDWECYCREPDLPPDAEENGRGLCLLHEIFDAVNWNSQGTQLRLCKQHKKGLISKILP